MMNHALRVRPAAWLAAVAVGAALGLASCGGPGRLEIHPVRGQVLFHNQPAAHALVIFFPQGGSEEMQKLRPMGRAGTDGYFTLTTYEDGDGAPAGQYKVTVVWPGENPADPSSPNDPEGRIPRGPDRLQGRFAESATTPLSATVVAGKNDLKPLELR